MDQTPHGSQQLLQMELMVGCGQTVVALWAFQASRGIYTFLLYLSNRYADSDSKTLGFNGHTAVIYCINLFLSTPF